MTVDQEPPRGTDGGPPRIWKGVVATDSRLWKALVGASVTTENGQHAGEGRATEPRMSPGHWGTGKQEAQTAA